MWVQSTDVAANAAATAPSNARVKIPADRPLPPDGPESVYWPDPMDSRTDIDGAGSGARPAGLLPLGLLAAVCLLPALQTAVSVYWELWPFLTYPLLKLAIVAAPIVTWWAYRRPIREVLREIGLKRTRCLPGLVSGVILAAPILAAYYLLKSRGLISGADVIDKVRSLGVDHWAAYWGMAAFISLSNSLVEEYYWRGFVVSQLRGRLSGRLAVSLLAGGLFGLHHLFVMLPMLPPGVAALGILGIVFAGVVWSWMRLSGVSLLDCYVSHILADLAGFWAGWELIGSVS